MRKEVRDAEVANFARVSQLGESRGDFSGVHQGIRPMDEKDIDLLDVEKLE